MHAPTFLLIIFPLSHIFLSDICPIHSSHSTFYILFPFSLEVISRRIVVHFSISMFHVIFKITFKDTPTLESYLTFALLLTLKPFTFISRIIDHVFTKSVPQSIFDFSFVGTSIWPLVSTFACDSIISELSIVNDTISPHKNSSSVQKSVIKLPFVFIPVLEGNFCRTIEALTVDFAVLGGSGDLSFPILVEYLCELDGEHHAIAHFSLKL